MDKLEQWLQSGGTLRLVQLHLLVSRRARAGIIW